jgi:hypothetical protein
MCKQCATGPCVLVAILELKLQIACLECNTHVQYATRMSSVYSILIVSQGVILSQSLMI